jgi:TolB-like protein/Tfp pilus assembly protein PilF
MPASPTGAPRQEAGTYPVKQVFPEVTTRDLAVLHQAVGLGIIAGTDMQATAGPLPNSSADVTGTPTVENPEEIARQHSASEETARTGDSPIPPETPNSPWDRIKRHKVVEWSLAYAAFGYAALHSSQMLSETLEWPASVPRFTLFALLLGFPMAVTLAWYHGHRAQHRLSRTELSILISLLLVAGSVLWWVARSGHARVEALSGARGSVTEATPFIPPPHSIAVLPFTNESGDASQQYFSDGISEDLITALSQFPGLKVIGRTSAFQFRDSNEDGRSIGAKLGVAHLLEGSVQRSGKLVRVSTELIDTTDASTQWAERYDRPYKDLFALQDEITHAVTGALRAKLLPGEYAATQSERPPGGSLEAYNDLLQGRFYFFRDTEADYREAIEFYTQATQLDPHYALAWSELAQAWTTVSSYYLGGASAQEAYAKSREAADRALALSPELAAAHLARGYLLQNADLDWRGAEAEYRRAMELAPNDGEAKFLFGQQLATFDEVESAIELTRQALATEPLRAGWYFWLSNYLGGLNRLDEAEQAVRRAIELQPSAAWYHYSLTYIEVQRGNAKAALAAAQQEPPGAAQDSALALALQIGRDPRAAEAALRTLINKYAGTSAFQIAEVYAVRNDANATFEWLERAWSNRDSGIQLLLYDNFILRYKDDPRFGAFCRKVGLPVPREAAARKAA